MNSTPPASTTSIAAVMLVHKQLRDLLLAQRQTLQLWRERVATIQEDVVTAKEYDEVIKQLKEERQQHDETKSRLASESERLQFALGEIEVLTKQLHREKANFDITFGRLKEQSEQETSKNYQLRTKCSVVETEKQKQEDILSLRESKIKDLKIRLAKQKDSHKQQVSELNVQLQQEAYIARTLGAGRSQGKTKGKVGI